MTKEELEEIIYDAQKGAMGCGCCADDSAQKDAFDDAVDAIWKELSRCSGNGRTAAS